MENAENYTIQLSRDGGTTWTWKGTSPTTSFVCKNLDLSSEILFRVFASTCESGYAVSGNSEFFSSLAPLEPQTYSPSLLPVRPSGFDAVVIDASQVDLSWNASPNATSYKVETSDSSSGTWTTIYEGENLSFSHTGLAKNSTYFYRVSGVNSEGESRASYAISAVTTDALALNPGQFRITRANGTSLDQPLTVSLSCSGTGTVNTDYRLMANGVLLSPSGWGSTLSVVIPANETYVDIFVEVIDDTIIDPYETVVLALKSSTLYSIDPLYSTKTVTIFDNDILWDIKLETPDVFAGETILEETPNSGHFRISRTNGTGLDQPLTVSFSRGGTGTINSDYRLTANGLDLTTSVVIPANETYVDIFVEVIDDTIIDPYETVIITLQSSTSYNMDALYKTGTITIIDNDLPWDVKLETLDTFAGETLTGETLNSGKFRITRTNGTGLDQPLTVSFSRSGTGTINSDYRLTANGTNISTSVIIPANETYVDIFVEIIDDTIIDPYETVTLTLQSGTSYNMDALYKTGTITIIDNDLPWDVKLETLDAFAGETLYGETLNSGKFRITRTNGTGLDQPLAVSFSRSGTGTINADYRLTANGVNLTNSVVIPANETYVDVFVEIIDDALVDPYETVIITLQSGASYNLGVLYNTGIVLVADNDIAPKVWTESTQNGVEGGRDGYIELRRDNIQNELTVYFSLTGSTATNGDDYASIGTSVTFEKGQEYVKIPINVIDDNILEASTETVVLTLTPYRSNNIDQYILEGTLSRPIVAAVTITENETPPHVWIHSVQDAVEGLHNGYIRLERDEISYPFTVYYDISGTAIMGVDYGYLFKEVAFKAGEKYADIVVTAREDQRVEEPESVTIKVNDGLYNLDVPEATLFIHDKSFLSTVSLIMITNDYGNDVFRVFRDDTTDELDVSFTVSPESTAIPGTDIELLPGMSLQQNSSGRIHFEAGQNYVDIHVTSLDYYSTDAKSVTIELLPGLCFLGSDISATIEVKPPVIHARAVHDQYTCSAGSTLVVDDVTQGLLANDYDEATQRLLKTQQVSIELVNGPQSGTLTLNPDGTFQYVSQSVGGTDSFSYKLVTFDGRESNVCTVSIHTPFDTNGAMAPLPANQVPEFPVEFGAISVGWQYFNLDPTSEFTPLVIGTYQVSKTESRTTDGSGASASASVPGESGYAPMSMGAGLPENDKGATSTVATTSPAHSTTETFTVTIVSNAFANGDWTYSETVTWGYDTTYEGSTDYYRGGYSYVFSAWFRNGVKGFTYKMNASDSYDIHTTTDTNKSETDYNRLKSHDWGTSKTDVTIISRPELGIGMDTRTTDVKTNHKADGSYAYNVEGGHVSGTLYEESSSHDDSFVGIYQKKTNGEWKTTGDTNSNSKGSSKSGYEGEGTYTIIDSLMDELTYKTVDIKGKIRESGNSRGSYKYDTVGSLGRVTEGWSLHGGGDSKSFDETKYENKEKGKFSYDDYSDDIPQMDTTEEKYYRDDYSIDRNVGWNLINGTWKALIGDETEKVYIEDNTKSETKYEDTESLLKYEEFSESKNLDKHTLKRIYVGANWIATEGTATSNTYGKYYKDVMDESATYDQYTSGGNNEICHIEGSIGTVLRNEEEYKYDSESSISSMDWRLDSGTGYYRYATSMGDYAEGEGKYTREERIWNDIKYSYAGKIVEKWKDMKGTGGRTDYEVKDRAWKLKDEWSTETSTFEYLTTNKVEQGTKYGDFSVDASITAGGQTLTFDVTSDGRGNHVTRTHTTPSHPFRVTTSLVGEVCDYEKDKSYEITDYSEIGTKRDTNGKLTTKGTRNISEIDSFFEKYSSGGDASESSGGMTGNQTIDNYFERFIDYEWDFTEESDSLYKEIYKTTVTEYQDNHLSKSIENKDANGFSFQVSEEMNSLIDNWTETKKTLEFNAIADNDTTRNVTVTEEMKKDLYSDYDFTVSTDNNSANTNPDAIRSASSKYYVEEDKTTTGGSFKQSTGTATKDTNDRWKVGSTSQIESWNTETIDAGGLRTYDLDYYGTGRYPNHTNDYCFSLVEWDLTDSYKETYGYNREYDSRNESNPSIENHVTGNITAYGHGTSYHCWMTYWTSDPREGAIYDETVEYVGFYNSGYSYSKPTSPGFPALSNTHRVMSPEQAENIDTHYAEWLNLSLPGDTIYVQSQSLNSFDAYNSFAAYFSENGCDTLDSDRYNALLARLSENTENYSDISDASGSPDVIILVDEPDTTPTIGEFDPLNVDISRVDAMVSDGLAQKWTHGGDEYVYFADIPDGQNVQVFLLKKTRSWWQYTTGEEWHYEVVKYGIYPIENSTFTLKEIYETHNSQTNAGRHLDAYLSDVAAGKQYLLNTLTFALHLVPLGAGIDNTIEGKYGEAALAFTGDAAMILSFGASKFVQAGAKSVEIATATEKAAAIAKATQTAKYANYLSRGAMAIEGGLIMYNLHGAANAETGWDAAGHLGEATLRLFGVSLNYIAHARANGALREMIKLADAVPKSQIVNGDDVVKNCLRALESELGTAANLEQVFLKGETVSPSIRNKIQEIASNPRHEFYEQAKKLFLGLDLEQGRFNMSEFKAALHIEQMMQTKWPGFKLVRGQGTDYGFVLEKTVMGQPKKTLSIDLMEFYDGMDSKQFIKSMIDHQRKGDVTIIDLRGVSPQKAEEYLNAIRAELSQKGSTLSRMNFDVLSEKSLKTLQ